jgi:amidohydrolase
VQSRDAAWRAVTDSDASRDCVECPDLHTGRSLVSARSRVLPLLLSAVAASQLKAQSLAPEIDRRVAAVLPQVVAWRRDIHQHPELGFQETRTAGLVATELTRLGLEVRTGVGRTGVVGVLKGARPGPVVALRADMDALPVTEQVDLPFKSTVRTQYAGQEVGVMHACGHDMHVAMLLGVAEVLSGLRDRLPGTVVFLFQPNEEGMPGERQGADLMIAGGALSDPAPQAIFGLHVRPDRVGTILYRAGAIMAASDVLQIVVKGRQTHGAQPWGGVDPIVVASQIVLALQTIPSRQVDVTKGPAIVTVGMIAGGNRYNIIPDSVVMLGTVRTFDEGVRADIKERIRRTATDIAQSAGASATVDFGASGLPVTYNDPALTERMLPTLQRVAGPGNLVETPQWTPAEDFALYQQKIPGMYFFLGVTPADRDPATAPRNHSPLFFADEAALPIGVRAMANVAVDYLAGQGGGTRRP